jgi:hypothetical protein
MFDKTVDAITKVVDAIMKVVERRGSTKAAPKQIIQA